MPPVDVAAALAELRERRDEGEVGAWLLDHALERVAESLHETRFAGEARALGASLHLRGGAGFRLNLSRAGREGQPLSADHQASVNVWAGLTEQPEALTLDVRARELRYRSGRTQPLDGQRQRTGTLARLDRQRVSHLLGLPLRAPGRGLMGMITVELTCRGAYGADLGLFVGAARVALDHAQLLLDLGAMALALAPPAPAPAGPKAESAAHHHTLRLAEQAASSTAPLALVGPVGSGRAWLAAWVHERSPMRHHPLTDLDGHRVTAAELALALRAPGTALLRDLHGLSLDAQRALVAWLDEPGDAPARLIVTTTPGHDLSVLLRFDLARRLKLWILDVPGLDQRREDIPGLIPRLLAARLSRPEAELQDLLSEEALVVFAAGAYPNHLHDLAAAALWAIREAERQAAGRPLARLRAEHARLGLTRLLPAPPAVLDQLRPGARALVERAPALLSAPPSPYGKPPHLLALAEGFVGLVVAEALAAHPDPADAAARLGLGHQRGDGNHLKTLRAAEDKLTRLAERLDEPLPAAALAPLRPRRKRRA